MQWQLIELHLGWMLPIQQALTGICFGPSDPRSDQNAVDDPRPGGAGRFVDHLQQ